MPNNAYLRSTRREREEVNNARSKGLISGRTAGSHSEYDVYIWDPEGKHNSGVPLLELIQLKTQKGGKTLKVTDHKVYKGVIVTKQHNYLNEAKRERKRKSKRKASRKRRSSNRGDKRQVFKSGPCCNENLA